MVIVQNHCLTVWLEMFGCHIFVTNFMTGGLKGYSLGILMETSYVPPSYGVPDGPLKEPLRSVILSPTVSAKMLEAESARMSARSFAIRLAL